MMSTLVKDFNTSNHLLLALRFFQEDDKYEYNHRRKLRVTNKYEDMDSLPHQYCLKLLEQNSNGWGVLKAYNH
jgi:hypothetical protein